MNRSKKRKAWDKFNPVLQEEAFCNVCVDDFFKGMKKKVQKSFFPSSITRVDGQRFIEDVSLNGSISLSGEPNMKENFCSSPFDHLMRGIGATCVVCSMETKSPHYVQSFLPLYAWGSLCDRCYNDLK